MFFRLVGFVLTLGLVGYLYVTMSRSTDNAIANNPTVVEQKKTLDGATGINSSDPKALEKYTLDQAKQIQEYQNQSTTPTE